MTVAHPMAHQSEVDLDPLIERLLRVCNSHGSDGAPSLMFHLLRTFSARLCREIPQELRHPSPRESLGSPPRALRHPIRAPQDIAPLRLFDHIAQCRLPFVVVDNLTGLKTRLSGALELAPDIVACPIRYVMSDELVRLCTDLAYSRGTGIFDCIDLIRVPTERLWLEWREEPWQSRLRDCGFAFTDCAVLPGHRRGVFIRANREGLKGSMRAMWSAGADCSEVQAGAIEAHFELDADHHGSPSVTSETLRVADSIVDTSSVLPRCFQFDFERSWASYYRAKARNPTHYRELQEISLGPVATTIPVVLAFLLLLHTKNGLPQQIVQTALLNRRRARLGKPFLLDHIEVHSPIRSAPAMAVPAGAGPVGRRGPRLHHVRGHLFRRANRLTWRVPHLRGKASRGVLRSRTVEWEIELSGARSREPTRNRRPLVADPAAGPAVPGHIPVSSA